MNYLENGKKSENLIFIHAHACQKYPTLITAMSSSTTPVYYNKMLWNDDEMSFPEIHNNLIKL
jgi:hypothetical protein